jgi:HEAT repeat protein
VRATAVAAAAGLLAVAPPGGPDGWPVPFPGVARAVAQPVPQPPVPQPPAAQPAVVPPASVQPAAGFNVDQVVARNLQQDRQALLAGRTAAEQDEAARRLVARQTPAARAHLLDALGAANNPRAQLAAARAMADDTSPDSQAVGPLGDLLGVERVGEAAAAALLNLRTDAAFARVRDFVRTDRAATATIRALGTSTDQRVAELLVDLVERDANPTKRNFAADALVEMTGLADNGRSPAAWAAWWQANRGKTPDQFRAELLDRDRRRRRPTAPADVDALVFQLYQLAADPKKPDALRVVLDSPDAAVRAAGIRLAYRLFTAAGRLPESAVPRIRELIRDSSPDVRLEAARALGNLNDKPSLDALLAQLRVEPDVGIRAALMQAVVPMQDVRAAPELVRLLDDPSVRTATVAAETLAKIGTEIRKDDRLAAQVAASLTTVRRTRAPQDPTGDLQGACVEALVPLTDRQQQVLFQQLMRDFRQPVRVRKAALAGVGELADRNAAGAVYDIARDDRDDPAVRVAALEAMERLGDPGFAQQLFDLSRRGREDERVRQAARRAFERLLPQAADRQVEDWANQLLQGGQPADFAARVPVLAEKVRRLEAAGAGRAQDLAATLESIGDAHVRAGQPAQAIPYFQRALAAWAALGAQPATLAGVRQQLLGALLAAELYPEAVQFAQSLVTAGTATQPDVVPPLAKEVDRLNDPRVRQPAKAARLATEALKFRGLDPGYQRWLTGGLSAAQQQPGGRGPGQ